MIVKSKSKIYESISDFVYSKEKYRREFKRVMGFTIEKYHLNRVTYSDVEIISLILKRFGSKYIVYYLSQSEKILVIKILRKRRRYAELVR